MPTEKIARTTRVIADDFSALARLVPAREALQTQVGKGRFRVDTRLVRTPDAMLLRTRIEPATVAVTVPDPDFIAMIIPIRWAGEYRFNGSQVDPGKLCVSGGYDGYFAKGDQRDFFTVALRRNRFTETLAALRACHPEEIEIGDRVLSLPGPVMAGLRSGLSRTMRNAFHQYDPPGSTLAPEPIEDTIFAALLDAYMCATDLFPKPAPKSVLSPQRIVKLAEERFEAAGSQRISLADLCKASGVDRNTLQRTFRDLYGETPMTYFHKRRLAKARLALMESEPAWGGVKRAAFVAGLTELGRFSVEYRQLFGESPSATLQRDPPW